MPEMAGLACVKSRDQTSLNDGSKQTTLEQQLQPHLRRMERDERRFIAKVFSSFKVFQDEWRWTQTSGGFIPHSHAERVVEITAAERYLSEDRPATRAWIFGCKKPKVDTLSHHQ